VAFIRWDKLIAVDMKVKNIIWSIVILVSVYFIFIVSQWLDVSLPPWFKVIAGWISIVFYVCLLGMICYPLLMEMIEHKRLRSLGFPSRVTSEGIYHNLRSLRSARVRAEYLAGLRRRQVLLIGEVTEPPAELLRNPLVAEELARLREQWFGLVS
jgi:hypothetical protein